jgi:hypothetical protein
MAFEVWYPNLGLVGAAGELGTLIPPERTI